MAEQMELAGKHAARADGIHHITKLADRGIGQHAFEVRGDERRKRRDQGGDQAHQQHGHCPAGHSFEGGIKTRQQIDPGIDHRRGMDQGADRVGASIASGSQVWNGNCADFAAAATRKLNAINDKAAAGSVEAFAKRSEI